MGRADTGFLRNRLVLSHVSQEVEVFTRCDMVNGYKDCGRIRCGLAHRRTLSKGCRWEAPYGEAEHSCDRYCQRANCFHLRRSAKSGEDNYGKEVKKIRWPIGWGHESRARSRWRAQTKPARHTDRAGLRARVSGEHPFSRASTPLRSPRPNRHLRGRTHRNRAPQGHASRTAPLTPGWRSLRRSDQRHPYSL